MKINKTNILLGSVCILLLTIAVSIFLIQRRITKTQETIANEASKTGTLVRDEIKGASKAIGRDVNEAKSAVKEKAKKKYEDWKNRKNDK